MKRQLEGRGHSRLLGANICFVSKNITFPIGKQITRPQVKFNHPVKSAGKEPIKQGW